MKNTFSVSLIASLIAFSAFGQKNSTKPLTPARGHYRQLQTYSTKSQDAELDKQKFETDAATIERRMSLKPQYLTGVTLKDFQIPEVPANSSELTRAEINYLLELQKQRTPEDIRSSLYMANIWYSLRVTPADSTYRGFRKNLFHIGRSIGTWFNPDDLPLTADLMAKVWRDASFFIWSLKFKYARIRPYVIDKNVKNLEDTDWAAYPSGHAANSYINAYLYQELAPEFTDIFIKDAYDMAHSREIIGVHYPSDSEASRIFARQFVNKLFENEQFKKDFLKVKEEWALKAKEKFQR
ncbi:phosphatase [Chryseolinea lacunae]|uniref:Phosphatase n=1 Tax=Chryseolinea lacunae TaxID=2801331 RepID=A0ABS1KZH2_9BACT|nr:phosphatase [Chryseolinea lacunae]MBL0744662.1 phosphatase [Chryseolinea lacunae]